MSVPATPLASEPGAPPEARVSQAPGQIDVAVVRQELDRRVAERLLDFEQGLETSCRFIEAAEAYENAPA